MVTNPPSQKLQRLAGRSRLAMAFQCNRQRGNRRWLEPENNAYKPIELGEDAAFEVWGCIRNSIRML